MFLTPNNINIILSYYCVYDILEEKLKNHDFFSEDKQLSTITIEKNGNKEFNILRNIFLHPKYRHHENIYMQLSQLKYINHYQSQITYGNFRSLFVRSIRIHIFNHFSKDNYRSNLSITLEYVEYCPMISLIKERVYVPLILVLDPLQIDYILYIALGLYKKMDFLI